MKNFHPQWRPMPRPSLAFTLVELMVVLAIFSLVVIAGLYSHMLGLKMNIFTETKLNATHKARAALNQSRDEVRSAQQVFVGSGNASGFTKVPDNLPQQGNALQVFPTTATNSYVIYYVDTNVTKLTLNRMQVTAGRTNTQLLASDVTNQIPFHVEDYAGNTLTNSQDNRVICMLFEFYQFEFAVLQPGKRNFYDYYRLQTKVARRGLL